MAADTLTCEIRLRWWLMPCLHALQLFCWLFRHRPNMDRLNRVIGLGIYTVVR